MHQESWFNILNTPLLPNQREHYSWLANLPSHIECIANFGCIYGLEPFALIWTLNAKEVVVIDIEEEYIHRLQKQIDFISTDYPESLQGRAVNHVCRDMTQPIPEMPDQFFDLAYCENVLYLLQGNSEALEYGISQMVRVVKPSGFIIAVEPKFGAKFETQKVLGMDLAIPNTESEPEDMSTLFASKELRSVEIPGNPLHTYCYQKNHD
jgi:SAM-dependent methyltransferase